jgi:hypothetical protein
MTNKIVTALEDGLKDVSKSAEDGGEAYAKHVEETGSKLEGDAKAHASTDGKNKDDLTKAGEKKDDPASTAHASTAEKDAADKAAAEKAAAEKEAADKAAAEKAAAEAKAAAEKAAATKAKVDDLRTQGHAPQRHLDASDAQLEGRLGKPLYKKDGTLQTDSEGYVLSNQKMDPARTDAASLADTDPLKYKDMYKTTAAGAPKNHSCGPFATAFGSPEDMAKAEDAAHKAISPADPADTRTTVSLDAKTVLGDDGVSRLRGTYIDPSNPVTGTAINYKDADFSGSSILAVYDKNASGGWDLTTMYPEPDKAVNK